MISCIVTHFHLSSQNPWGVNYPSVKSWDYLTFSPSLTVSLLLSLLFPWCPNIVVLCFLFQYLICPLTLPLTDFLFLSHIVPNVYSLIWGWGLGAKDLVFLSLISETLRSYSSSDDSSELGLPNKTWLILRPELTKPKGFEQGSIKPLRVLSLSISSSSFGLTSF